jgi:glycosyltransferase involved in cell wall biosynthesis
VNPATDVRAADSQRGVSVVVPCHNSARFVVETLESALRQHRVDVSIVVVDDGSTDDTVERVRALSDSRIQIVALAHAGASAARRAGVERADAPFVLFLDSDDVLVDGTLAARVDMLMSSGADVAYTDWRSWAEQAGGWFADGPIVARELGESPESDLLRDFWWPPGALLYRRRLTERLVWREDLPIIQDARYVIDAAIAGARFVHVPGLGLRYRVGLTPSLSRRDPRAFLLDCIRSAEELHDDWQARNALTQTRRATLIELFSTQARNVFKWDRATHARLLDRLEELAPGLKPGGSRWFRALSRSIGYTGAEHVASAWRRVRSKSGHSRPSA